MTEYDSLLEEVKRKAIAFQSIAKKYIPRMYEALRNEDPNISPQDARERIEKDCIGFWSKRTILEVLPAEAKNQEKQKAGRLSQKKRSFAAVSAAPPLKEIILDIDGRPVDEALAANTSSTKDGLSFQDKDVDNKESKNLSQYDAKNATPNDVVEFEYSLQFEEVRMYLDQISQQNKGSRKVFFHGTINVRTGSVLSASVGCLQR